MWSWKIGSVFGIALKIHATFPLALVYAAFQFGWGRSNPLPYALYGVLLVLLLFFCVLLHELGHALAAQRYKIPVAEIILLPIGGLAKLRMLRETPKEEFVIAAAGPMVNLIIAAILTPFLFIWFHTNYPGVMASWQNDAWGELLYIVSFSLRQISRMTVIGGLTYLIFANITLFVFNLVPAFPMDGGRLLRATLATFLKYRTATSIAVRTGQFMAVLSVFWALQGNYSLLLVAAFIFVSGSAELQRVQFRTILERGIVSSFMKRGLQPLFPQWNVYSAQLLAMQTGQQAFPVVENGRLLGLLTMSEMGPNTPTRTVGDAMIANYPVVNPQRTLYDAQVELAHHEQHTAAVMDQGIFLGIISLDDIEKGYYALLQGQRPLWI